MITEGNITEQFVGITKATIDRMLKTESPSECLALYTFYAYTKCWQQCTDAKATRSYVAKALGWSESKVTRYKKILSDIHLIEDIKRRDEKGKVSGWYVKINYMVTKSSCMLPIEDDLSTESKSPLVDTATRWSDDTQIHSTNNKIHSTSNNKIHNTNIPPISPNGEESKDDDSSDKEKLIEEQINELYNLYPLKAGRGQAFRAIKGALNKESFETLKESVIEYRDCVLQWEEDKKGYIPHPSTWFNGCRWEDDRSLWNRNKKVKKSSFDNKYGMNLKGI